MTTQTQSRTNSYSTQTQLNFAGRPLQYHSLKALEKRTGRDLSRVPRSLRVLLENLLRHEDGEIVHPRDIEAFLNWHPQRPIHHEIQFTPARVLLQDFTGVPVVADLAAMRSEIERQGGDPQRVNPLQPVDLVIDHSVQVDAFASHDALKINSRHDFLRNRERYEFLKWGQSAFNNFQVVPPETGICHQVNLEYLSRVAMTRKNQLNEEWVYFDSLVGTDSHTPMINGLGVLGWGVGGIEAEAAMLGQPCSMLIPEVVGVELHGALPSGVTATDLVLTITQLLRRKGVVGKFVEFYGPGVQQLSIADRATISNMAPEYGATVGFWPVDRKTTDYLQLTGRSERAQLTEAYFVAQGLWSDGSEKPPEFNDTLQLDLATIEPSLAGPAKPHDRTHLSQVKTSFRKFLSEHSPTLRGTASKTQGPGSDASSVPHPSPSGKDLRDPGKQICDGSVVIAAITSCTNTSNPALMIGAALLAQKATVRGLKAAPWVKTSFAPGSTAVPNYIRSAGLMPSLEALGFHLVGFGCTTCIGNSGPLSDSIAAAIETSDLTVAAVLSGNRNFEARIHPLVRANYLASPPLVVAFAIAGRIDIDLTQEPLGTDPTGQAVYLKDIWPPSHEVDALLKKHVTPEQFSRSYGNVFTGPDEWQALPVKGDASYNWSDTSTYIKRPPFLDAEFTQTKDSTTGTGTPIANARALGFFGDFITTDHISPAGAIGSQTPAGQYLLSLGIAREEFNSYGARRGNHEVMARGTFANVRLKNQLVKREGGYTVHWASGTEMSIYEAAVKYRSEETPLIILAGREYGSGSSRDWAAKGPRLLGVRAVIAESFERIHRSNLVGMGILPLQFRGGQSAQSLGLKGNEYYSIDDLGSLTSGAEVTVYVNPSPQNPAPAVRQFQTLCRIDTPNELQYYQAGGILPYVLKNLH